MAEYVEVLIFRGVMALVSNARDQRGASQVNVTLDLTDQVVRATVEDNGRGFGTGRLLLDADKSAAFGFSALQERLALVGGSLILDSASSTGAKLQIEVPAEKARGA
jgi:two-component system sensor histidine kinase DegS